MDHQGRRPPRSARPNQQPLPPPPSHSEPSIRPAYGHHEPHQNYVSFQNTERGARNGPIDHPRQPGHSSYSNNTLSATSDPTLAETGGYSGVGRKKSLVRPEREKIEPGHRQWHYRSHAAGEAHTTPGVNVLPSRMNLLSRKFLYVDMFHFSHRQPTRAPAPRSFHPRPR